MGAQKRHHFFQKVVPEPDFQQAKAAWQWIKFLHSNDNGLVPVHINLDETSIKLMPQQPDGHLSSSARARKRSPAGLALSVSRGQMRGAVTYLCCVADNEAAQKLLPQVVLVSKRLVTREKLAEIKAAMPGCIHIIEGESSWMTVPVFCKILTMMHEHLASMMATHSFHITADCFRAHLSADVWRHCRRLGFRYSLIPAKLTWALQPCDTHVFRSFKRVLAGHCMRAMVEDEHGVLTKLELFVALAKSIEEVTMAKSWAAAFTDCGLTGACERCSDRVLRKLSFETVPFVSDHLPSLAQLQAVFPVNMVIPITNVFGLFLTQRSAEPTHTEHRAVTRSMSTAAASSALSAPSSSAACPPHRAAMAAAPLPPPLPPPMEPPPQPVLRLPSSSRLPPAAPRDSAPRSSA